MLLFAFAWMIFFLSTGGIFASTFPFTDVPTSDPAYKSIKNLFDQGIISDDGTHLFRGNEPMNRDHFVALSVSVSCKKCLTPSSEDIIQYQFSPFVDLKKQNEHYYCIAYASDKKIVQGYMPDQTGKSSCQDGQQFSSSTFCEKNKTSRIESVAMLLRQANLWNDTLNNNYSKKIEISDVSPYWHWYAEKWIQAGILSIKDGGKVYPDEYISRSE